MISDKTRKYTMRGNELYVANTISNGNVCIQNHVAVSVCNAFKQYGKRDPVLVNLNMTVAKGTIYGLLGASGCGKTTLLSCLVGRRKLDSGKILVFDGEPGTKDSRYSQRVGYMPQELALYDEFTIKETMMYFGWIFGMKTEEIFERINFLLDLLHLPSQNRYVKDLSCGQQRRVSFAVALIHDPDLLILDEPTVGVDPLLRQTIWNHLVHLSKVERKTIIITTHYIEEARQAHKIGLMRSGILLAEESPQTLMTMHGCHNLESVFLALSRKQDNSNEVSELNVTSSLAGPCLENNLDAPVHIRQESGVVGLSYRSNDVTRNDNGTDKTSFNLTDSVCSLVPNLMDVKEEVHHTSNVSRCPRKMRALLQKNYLRITRNRAVLIFFFVSPILQVSLYCLAVGRDPTDMKLAIANKEVNGTECNFEPGCHFRNLSCRYLNHLNQNLVREYYSDAESAIRAVRTGEAWGAVYFHVNFSIGMADQMVLGLGSTAEVVSVGQSEVQVWLDMSNHQIASLLSHDLQVAYRDFSYSLLKDCYSNRRLSGTPIRFNEPIYGSSNLTFTDFAAPGVIISIVFFLAVGLTTSTLVQEKAEGLWDRSRVAGVLPHEFLFSHVISQFGVMCCQTTLVMIFILLVFDIKCSGSVLLLIVLTLLQGMNGMCFGFFVSAISDSEYDAVPLTLGSFYPTLLLSGVIWPLEGMPIVLRDISHFLPITQAITALRCIFARGWGLGERDVYLGFLSTLCWIVLFLTFSLVFLKYSRRK